MKEYEYSELNSFIENVTYNTKVKIIHDIVENKVYFEGKTEDYFKSDLKNKGFVICSAEVENDYLLIRALV